MDDKKAVIISGTHPSQTYLQAIENSAECWTCNTGYKAFGRRKLDKLFIMHRQVYKGFWKKIPVFEWDDIKQKSISQGFEIITLHNIAELNTATRYPLGPIVQSFFPARSAYFTSSFDYMVAYALYRGFHHLHLVDVDFFPGISKKTDDFYERCGSEYWLGRAHSLGVKTTIWGASNLLKTRTGALYAING